MVGSVLTITCLMNKNAGEGEIRGGAGSCRMSRGTCSRRGIERTVMPRCSKRLSFLIVSIFIHTVLMRIQSLVDLKSESTIRKEQFPSCLCITQLFASVYIRLETMKRVLKVGTACTPTPVS